jgi:hypothetical protein
MQPDTVVSVENKATPIAISLTFYVLTVERDRHFIYAIRFTPVD